MLLYQWRGKVSFRGGYGLCLICFRSPTHYCTTLYIRCLYFCDISGLFISFRWRIRWTDFGQLLLAFWKLLNNLTNLLLVFHVLTFSVSMYFRFFLCGSVSSIIRILLQAFIVPKIFHSPLFIWWCQFSRLSL